MAFQINQLDNLDYDDAEPLLAPYFPEWQRCLALPTAEFRSGRHVFKVTLLNAPETVWRRIAMDADATLFHLSDLIRESVGFDDDHLDKFTYKTPMGRTVEAYHPFSSGDLLTTEVNIGDLPLPIGGAMEYLYDFGDRWQFEVVLETVEAKPDAQGVQKIKQKSKRKPPKSWGEILESHGEAPEQYPDADW